METDDRFLEDLEKRMVFHEVEDEAAVVKLYSAELGRLLEMLEDAMKNKPRVGKDQIRQWVLEYGKISHKIGMEVADNRNGHSECDPALLAKQEKLRNQIFEAL